MNYNPTPVVVCLYRVGENLGESVRGPAGKFRLLAVRRNVHPFVGELAFPGGFVDEGETAEQAAARELEEETGIASNVAHWRPLTTRITPKNQLLIFMRHISPLWATADDVYAMFVPNREVQELRLVDVGDTLCFPLHQEVLGQKPLWD